MTTDAYRANYREIEWLPIPKERRVRQRIARSHLPCPMVIRDDMEPVQSQVTGRWHTSKSGIRAEYKRHGVVEVGNDPARHRKRGKQKVDRKAIHTTIQKAEARFSRGERAFDRNWST